MDYAALAMVLHEIMPDSVSEVERYLTCFSCFYHLKNIIEKKGWKYPHAAYANNLAALSRLYDVAFKYDRSLDSGIDRVYKGNTAQQPNKTASNVRHGQKLEIACGKLRFPLAGQPESDCQTGSVSQNQICQRKHHIQFCRLLLQPSVAGLPVSKLTFDDSKYVFYFCPDG